MPVNFGALVKKDFRRLAVRRDSVWWLFLAPLATFGVVSTYFSPPAPAPHHASTLVLALSVCTFHVLLLFTQGVGRLRDALQRSVRLGAVDYLGMILSRLAMGLVQLLFVAAAAWGAFRWPIPPAGERLLLLWLSFSFAMTALSLLWGRLWGPRTQPTGMGLTLAFGISATNGFFPATTHSPRVDFWFARLSPSAWLLSETERVVLDPIYIPITGLSRLLILGAISLVALRLVLELKKWSTST